MYADEATAKFQGYYDRINKRIDELNEDFQSIELGLKDADPKAVKRHLHKLEVLYFLLLFALANGTIPERGASLVDGHTSNTSWCRR